MKIEFMDLNLKEAPNESPIPPPCLKKEREMMQQTEGTNEAQKTLQPKPPLDTNKKPPDIEPKVNIEYEPLLKIEEKTTKKEPRRWRDKKIPTSDFSPGDKVVLAYYPSPNLFGYYTVNKILSLGHVEIIKEDTRKKFTERGEKLKPYDPT